MNYTGIDWHKRYSVCYTVDRQGKRLNESRIEGNRPEGFARYFMGIKGRHAVVHEACWNWAKLHEWLDEIDGVEEVVLAHPYKTRLIADAQIKTDRLDAKALATLLRGDLVARVHIPAKPIRQRKLFLCQRRQGVRLCRRGAICRPFVTWANIYCRTGARFSLAWRT